MKVDLWMYLYNPGNGRLAQVTSIQEEPYHGKITMMVTLRYNEGWPAFEKMTLASLRRSGMLPLEGDM